jgi:CAAX prenyl protease-like protein
MEVDHRSAVKFRAFVAPMVLFLLLLALNSGLKAIGRGFWMSSAEFWLYPLQTFACGALLVFYRREYRFRPFRGVWLIVAVGAAVFVVWVAPQSFFGIAPRRNGFDPTVLHAQPIAWSATVILRFARLVVVVPLVEEIFWRGFLLRYLIKDEFWRVPFGAFSWFSFVAVTIAFAFSHTVADWPAALICGALYNWIAYRTKSLGSCVLTHALTNLLLGAWIMHTGQWGFW